jgi:YHS domain-containing protein
MEVEITPTAIQTVYENKTYYFCAEHCRRTFSKDPAHFSAM